MTAKEFLRSVRDADDVVQGEYKVYKIEEDER